MVIRGPEPELSPQKKIEETASIIIGAFRATLIRTDFRRIVCDNEEIDILEIFVSKIPLETVIQMNLKMAENLAKNTDKVNITPLFVLENS